MTNVDTVKELFSDRFLTFGGTNLLKPNDALEFINIGQANFLTLEGVDGFHILESGAIQPNQDISFDAVDFDDPAELLKEVTATIQKVVNEEGVVFEVIFS